MPPVPSPAAPALPTRDAGEVGGVADVGQQRAARGARVGVVQPVDVGEQHQQVGVDQVRDQRGQPVVVAEPDLGGRHRVVLVDDREHAELEELGEGLVGVAVVRAPGHVVDGEQHLAGHDAVPRQLLGVAVHQQPLADRRRGLLGRERPGPALQAAAAPARPRWHRRRPGPPRRRGPRLAASTSTSCRTRAGSMPPSAVVSEDEPTFTTTRRAAGDLSRGRHSLAASVRILRRSRSRTTWGRSACAGPVSPRSSRRATSARVSPSARSAMRLLDGAAATDGRALLRRTAGPRRGERGSRRRRRCRA